jgi:hypothetical protein
VASWDAAGLRTLVVLDVTPPTKAHMALIAMYCLIDEWLATPPRLRSGSATDAHIKAHLLVV